MFWGLEINNSSAVSMKVDRSFHISKAVLCAPSPESRYSSTDGSPSVDVYLQLEDGLKIQICKFSHSCFETQMDLNFSKGEKLTFSLSSNFALVHLSGYYMDQQEELRVHRAARADLKMDQLVDICNRILERTYHIN